MYFRCWVWQAQILDAIRGHLLLEHTCEVYKVIRHEDVNLLISSVVFLSVSVKHINCCTYYLLPQPF